MTIPHMMNCDHQGEGWCLSCVSKLGEKLIKLEEKVEIAAETLHNPADMRPELIGTGEEGLWKIMFEVGSMLVNALAENRKECV